MESEAKVLGSMFSGLKKTVSSLTSDETNPKAKDPYAIGVENESAAGAAVHGNRVRASSEHGYGTYQNCEASIRAIVIVAK